MTRLLIQPNGTTGIDTKVNEIVPDTGSATSTYLGSTGYAGVRTFGLFKFDLSGISDPLDVTSAALMLVGVNQDGPLEIRRILAANSGWTEAATWNFADGSTVRWAGDTGGDGGSDAGCSIVGTDVSSTSMGTMDLINGPCYAELDLTEFRAMIANNHGLRVAETGTSAMIKQYWSSDYSTADLRPALFIGLGNRQIQDAGAYLLVDASADPNIQVAASYLLVDASADPNIQVAGSYLLIDAFLENGIVNPETVPTTYSANSPELYSELVILPPAAPIVVFTMLPPVVETTDAAMLRIPYDDATDLDGITPLQRELLYDTTNDEVRYGDGTTPGGIVLAKKDHTHGATHAAVTLGANAGAVLGLTDQELTLDSQNANLVLAGPTTGAAADPTFRALVAADIPALGYVPTSTLTAMLEPTGFVNRTDSALTFTDGTLTLQIAPTGGGFAFYSAGTLYTKTIAQTKAIANTAGLHFVYFDTAGVLQETTDPWDIASANVPVACVYWNGTTGILMDERHGIQMDGRTHEYLHETRGPAFAHGMAGTFAADGSTITIESGEWYDDDLEWEPAQQTTCRVFYLDGTTWKWTAAQAPYFHVVSSAPQYNNAGALAAVDANKYSMSWVFATNHASTPIAVIMGQAQYTTQAQAEAAGLPNLASLPAAEMLLLYKVIWQRNGAVITRIRTDDYRRVTGGPIANYLATDHGALAGLADNDHPQYVLDPATPEQGDTLYWNGTAWLRLAHGTAGQYLKTGGHAGNPSWDTPAGGAAATRQSIFTVSGVLAVAAGTLRIYNQLGAAQTISKVFLAVDTAPMGAAIIVDLHLDGTTIFTNQAHRPQVAASANTGETTDIDDATWGTGEYLTMHVDQIGSTVAGSDLVVHIVHS